MKNKKIPMRTCVISHEKHPKKDLIRIVRSKDGMVSVDESGKLNGKGVYLKLDKEIIDKAKKSKILNKYLEVDVNDNIYDELYNLLK